MYFRARNGTFHRVAQKANVGFEQANGGMTVYYTPVISGSGKVTAFKPVRAPLPPVSIINRLLERRKYI